MIKNYNLALIGFGGVNRALASIINSYNNRLQATEGFSLKVVGISDSWLGSVFDQDGLPLEQLMQLPSKQGILATMPGGKNTEMNKKLIYHAAVDIVCEATVTNPENGLPALDYCEWALEAGKHVTTTNKGPVAFAGQWLQGLAAEKSVEFQFEGTVMSGTPIIRYAQDVLRGCKIQGFTGILNGTANYVLGQIEQGQSFVEAVKQAQDNGYAEANPDADILGLDVMLKVVILANTLLGQSLSPNDITCTGINSLTESQVRNAVAEGKCWKMLGSGHYTDNGSVRLDISPQLLSGDNPLAGINGVTNGVIMATDLLGDVMIAGPGAGRIETGYALLSDIIAIHKNQTRSARSLSYNDGE